MTSRLKSLSDNSLVGDRPAAPFFEPANDDEDVERRARYVKRKQNLGQNEGLERNGNLNASGLFGLSAAQMVEHYNNCIKLSVENKISVENAFNLHLIDYMRSMIKKKESNLNNFQVAAGTLDASTKIYAYRVDSVYKHTLKFAGGLRHTEEGQGGRATVDAREEECSSIEETSFNSEVKRKPKRSSRIEKNLKNINFSKFELEFKVDLLFKKTSAQFDGGSLGSQFLATLNLKDDACELLLDCNAVVLEVNCEDNSMASHGFSYLTGIDANLENLCVLVCI